MVYGITIAGVILMLLMLLAYFLLNSWKKKKKNKSQSWSSFILMCIQARTDQEQKDQRGSTITSPRTGDKPLIMQSSGPPLSTSSSASSAALDGRRKQSVSQAPPRPSMITVFSFEELAVATEGFSKARILGCGGFGYVYHGVLPDGKEVAVKQMKAESRQGEREFHAEVEIISGVHHRHLVSLVGYCYAQDKRVLVYEFVPNNSLEFHLHGQQQQVMGWSTRLKIALRSAKGLAYLHEDCVPRIIHRDVKAANILLDFSFEVKVADFGLARSVADGETHVSTRVMGTFGYLAPEYASTGKLTEKSDVFSYGVILLELITGRRAVVQLESYMHESLADWARPLLAEALESKRYDRLVDPRLKMQEGDGHCDEMLRLVACTAACVPRSAGKRPRMVQVVRALEGSVLVLKESNEACGCEQNWEGFGGSDMISSGGEGEEATSSIRIQQSSL